MKKGPMTAQQAHRNKLDRLEQEVVEAMRDIVADLRNAQLQDNATMLETKASACRTIVDTLVRLQTYEA